MPRVGKKLIDWCKENGERGEEVWNGVLAANSLNKEDGIDIYNISASSHTKIHYECKNGHNNNVRLDSITSNGSWCKTCMKMVGPQTRIKNQIEKGSKESFYHWCCTNNHGKIVLEGYNRACELGYNLDIDINSISSGAEKRVYFICDKGHLFNPLLTSVTVQGSWCKDCYELNKSEIVREKGKLTRIKSGKSLTFLNWCFKNGDVGKSIYKAFMRCYDENSKNNIFIDKELSKSNYSAYFKCDNPEHPVQYKVIADVTRHSSFCSLCGCHYKTSKPEQTIYLWCKENFKNVTNMDRSLGMEADVLIEDLKLVIEYQGEYYHRNKAEKDKQKKIFFESLGYKVLQIYEKTGKEFTTTIISNDIIYHRYNLDKDCRDLITILVLYFNSFDVKLKCESLSDEIIQKVKIIMNDLK